jgi:tetratricopeptide (TPR) repeat protein
LIQLFRRKRLKQKGFLADEVASNEDVGMKEPARLARFLIILPVVLLPASRAFAQVKTPKWTEVRSPHFTVLTDGGERQARRLAEQFEAIRSVFEQTLRLRVESGKPFAVMAFRDEKSMRAAMPEYWEKKGLAHPAGGLQSGGDKIYAFIRLDAGDESTYRIVNHEYTHMVLRLSFRSLPLWVSEGLAEFYGNSTIGEREVGLGRPNAYGLEILRGGRQIPLAELFRVSYDSPYYRDADKAPMFYSESWALTHYLMLTERTEAGQPNRLSRFLSLLGQGVDQDEAMRRVFDDLGRLQTDLARYVERSAFPYVWVKTKAAGAPQDFVARVLSPAETAERLGDFRLHDGQLRDAKPLLEEALRLQPDLASAQESLGFLLMRQGDRAEALRWFDRAIAGDSRNFLAHYYHATLTLAELGTAEGAGQAEASLGRALQLNPHFAPAYVALARIYLGDDRKVERALELVRKAVDIEPGNFSYQMMFGAVLVRLGRNEEALKLAQALERSARSQEEKSRARSFLESANQVQEKRDPGVDQKQDSDQGVRETRAAHAPAGSQPFSFSWSILSQPVLVSNTLHAAGSGDGLYISKTYDDVWAATIRALTKDYEILYSGKDSGHIMAERMAGAKADPAFGSITVWVEERDGGIGVNITVPLDEEIPLSKRTALYKSLFEDIAAILAGGSAHLDASRICTCCGSLDRREGPPA